MILQSSGQYTSFQTPILVKPSNSSVDALSHLSLSGERGTTIKWGETLKWGETPKMVVVHLQGMYHVTGIYIW